MADHRMRAAVIRAPGKPWDITELTYDDPKDHEVVVRLHAAGMCHSDDHLRSGDTPMRYPIVGGHEGSGIVEQVGPLVSRVAVGDRVVATFIPACGICRYCSTGKQNMCDKGLYAGTGQMLDGTYRLHAAGEDLGGFCALGTFAEAMVVSEYSVQPLPDDIPFEIGALLSCGVPTGWGSAVRAAQVEPGQTVVIYGSGGVGANAVQGAALSGAARVIVVDPSPWKRERAAEFGATHTFETNDEAMAFVGQATQGQMADHAIITVSVNNAETVGQAMFITGKAGQVTLTAVGNQADNWASANGNLVVGYEKRIQGALFGSCRVLTDIPLLMDLYRVGKYKLDELITNRYTLEQVNEGYADLLAGKNIRGVIRFPEA
jgi:S-(hydroxymethyl)glutathione dehydrogenase/alcohol dehydrogenase